MSITPPALRATSPFFDRGGAANALLAESKKKHVNVYYPSGTVCHLPFLRQGRSG